MKNVLVLGVGGNVSMGILKVLVKNYPDLKIIGSCVYPESFAMYLCDDYVVSPFANADEFIPWLSDICQQKAIDIIFTGVEEIIKVLEANQDLLKGLNVTFIASSAEKLHIGQNKYLTSRWLKENGCNYPLFARLDNKEELDMLLATISPPYIVKPISGKGSKGISIISDVKELDDIRAKHEYIVQELIGNNDSEYTIGCFVNKKGHLFEPMIMHRKLQNGTTVYAEIVENEVIKEECIKICERFAPKGPLNIQLRLSKDGRPVCFELNVRFSGTTPMRDFFGFKDVDAVIQEYLLDREVNTFKVRKGKSLRYLNEVYVEEGQFLPGNIFVEGFGVKKQAQ